MNMLRLSNIWMDSYDNKKRYSMAEYLAMQAFVASVLIGTYAILSFEIAVLVGLAILIMQVPQT